MMVAKTPNKFPSKCRLKRRRDFQHVRSARCSVSDPHLVLYVAENGLEVSRLGIVAGKRLGKAVARNRMKRLIREAFRLQRIGLDEAGFDLVCIPRGGPPRSLEQYKSSLLKLFEAGVGKLKRLRNAD